MIKILLCLITINLVKAQNFTETKIHAPGGTENAFGSSVLIEDNYLYIGAIWDNNYRGSVYIYHKSDNNWQFKLKLQSPFQLSSARFGASIAKLKDYLFIGAFRDTSYSLTKGTVYIFKIFEDNLVFHQRLVPQGGSQFADFGSSIAVNENYLIIGAPGETGIDSQRGAAYLYKLEDDYYNFQYKIQESDIHQNHLFGFSVCLINDYIFVGAPQADDAGKYSGAVYFYKIQNDSVELLKKVLGSNVSSNHIFGVSLAADLNFLSIGASGNIISQKYPGGVYIYEVNKDSISEKYFITPDIDSTIYFGSSIKLCGDSLLVGALGDIGVGGKGKGYLYVKKDSIWINKYYFAAGDNQNTDYFGESCAMLNNTFIFGAPNYGGSGAVYVYEHKIVSVNDLLIIKNSFHLSQNYPNPFNSVTKIKFVIPTSDVVQIKIYNILGREMKTVLKEYKEAGVYEAEFAASNLPSGIYYYRIISGNYSDTKKMILLK